MTFMEIAAKAVEMAQGITFLTGDWEASAILLIVKHFLEGLDGTTIISLLQSIIGF